MKNLSVFCLCLLLIAFAGLACKKGSFAGYGKQYKCTLPNEPEPQTAEDYIKRGYKHIELNNYADSFDECAFGAAQEALRLEPQNADALVLRGQLYRVKGDYDAALDDLNEAMRLKPGNVHFHQIRSTIYEKKEMFDKAIEDLSVVVQDSKSDFEIAHRGKLYFNKGDYENALKDYTAAIALKPDEAYYYTMRAEIYRKLGKTKEAEADEIKAKEFEDALTEDAKTPDAAPSSSKPEAASNSDSKMISGGVLNGKATTLPKPAYPPAAKAVRASGAVNVQVVVDEKGDVVSAIAISGHPLLKAAAVSAARGAKFSPTLLSGKPVKVTGVLVFNFTPE